MSKNIELVIHIQSDDTVEPDEINLLPDEVIDGFTISRDTQEDITHIFRLQKAEIVNRKELI